MKQIAIFGGRFALVDDEDFERLSKYKWHINNSKSGEKTYAICCLSKGDYKRNILMHRLIIQAKKGQYIDHINGDTFDNRKENLRKCTNSQNLANRNKTRVNKSGYKGVFFQKQRKSPWREENISA